MDGRQLHIPFPQGPSENLEENIRIKSSLASWLSASDRMTEQAKLITNKQVILQPK